MFCFILLCTGGDVNLACAPDDVARSYVVDRNTVSGVADVEARRIEFVALSVNLETDVCGLLDSTWRSVAVFSAVTACACAVVIETDDTGVTLDVVVVICACAFVADCALPDSACVLSGGGKLNVVTGSVGVAAVFDTFDAFAADTSSGLGGDGFGGPIGDTSVGSVGVDAVLSIVDAVLSVVDAVLSVVVAVVAFAVVRSSFSVGRARGGTTAAIRKSKNACTCVHTER